MAIIERRGRVTTGYGIASGRNGPAFGLPQGSLALQLPAFLNRGWDLNREAPGFRLGTINVELEKPLRLANPDVTLRDVDWCPSELAQPFPPETFSFVRCCIFHSNRFVPGIIYYPHPETKPSTNNHDSCVLEVIAPTIAGLDYGQEITILCRSDAFVEIPEAEGHAR
ncbi:MAG: hypothetical protein Q8K99_10850 [Actinomycetota bacterium]|nr:hypothetical protein [Actinomycetota bacterium]